MLARKNLSRLSPSLSLLALCTSLVVVHDGSTNSAYAQETSTETATPTQQVDAKQTEQTLPSPSPDDGWRPRKLTPETPRVQERSVEAIPAAGPLSRFFNKKKAGEEFQPRTPPSPPAKNAFRADTKPESESEPATTGFAPAMAGSWISRDSRKGVPSVEIPLKTKTSAAAEKPTTVSPRVAAAPEAGNMPASAGRTATEQIEPRKSSLDREPAKDALDTNVAAETTKTRPKSLELKPAAGVRTPLTDPKTSSSDPQESQDSSEPEKTAAEKTNEKQNEPSLRIAKREDINLRPKSDKPTASASVGDLPKASPPTMIDYTGRPTGQIRLTRSAAQMRRGIETTLSYFYQRPEIANGRSNWGMMHAMMVFGTDTQVRVGSKQHSTIAWIAGNNNCRGQRLLTQDANGVMAKSGVGLQGHQGQFLAVLGMCQVPTEYPLHAGKMKYSVADLIEAEQRACRSGVELTFTLIGLSHYLDTDSTWVTDEGEEWDFERLLAEELNQPIVGAACGGTHRLMGYAHALRKRRAEGKPITGQWKRAEVYTKDFMAYAYSLQNRDGSMSTKWFEGRADNGDIDRKIQTTGHVVEWLLTVTPDSQLQNPRLVRAVNFLMRSLYQDLDRDWSIGPKGHALRSLSMYHQRVFRTQKPWAAAMSRSARSGYRSVR